MGPINRRNLQREAGVTLMLAVFVLFALSFIVIALLHFSQYSEEIAGNVSVRAAAMQATDIGVNDADDKLQANGGFPEDGGVTDGGSWFYNTMNALPTASFWSGCNGTNCMEVSEVKVGRLYFNIYYTVEPTPYRSPPQNGTQKQIAHRRLYDAYVDVQLTTPPGVILPTTERPNANTAVEVTLAKVEGE